MREVFYIRYVEANSYFCIHKQDEFFTLKLKRAFNFNIEKSAKFHLENPGFFDLFKGRTLEICKFYEIIK